MPNLPRTQLRRKRLPPPWCRSGVAGAILVLLGAPAASAESAQVTAVRFWSEGDVTRIAIEATGDFNFHSDRLPNPDRLFFDLPGTRPALDRRGVNVIPVHDRFVRQIRIAETQHGVTRIVLDLAAESSFTTERLANPSRLIVELHAPRPQIEAHKRSVAAGELHAQAELAESGARSAIATPRQPDRTTGSADRPLVPPLPIRSARVFMPPLPAPQSPRATVPPSFDEPPAVEQSVPPHANSALTARHDVPPPPSPAVSPRQPASPILTAEAVPPARPASAPAEVAYPARRNANGDRSMIRVLGLKVNRIVIDAGHGGHDTGTIGPTGLREKDLVLDVAKRLGALVEERLRSQVIYTRDDDTFVPLEERTAIANRQQADLFISIHANSSPVPSASGVETYYLNFTTSRDALELAARENAESSMTVNDLQNVLQKIALRDKVDESREFALRVQTALAASSGHSPRARDRGIRKAPFVVLIGANMPSILAEIGFVSNPLDERQLRRPEVRQKIAEALFRGISQYAATLSHYQVATTKR